ncbi:M15 family metallopeptidase [Novosphingobium sp. BL-8A]|uniref:M15 family metallopeptidase n=1 Tax=Novosphingobium sp. BL-8A TaxID=3127639 RepID=UPI003756C85E
MSNSLFSVDVLFLQRLLSCCGLYNDKLDGDYGPHTSDAEEAFGAKCDAIAAAEGAFDIRSERNIRSLRTDAQELARRSIAGLRAAGFDARVISGTRDYAEQNALYKKGRFGDPGPIVTKARGGQSWHNFGLAWDIGLFRGGQYLTDDSEYKVAGHVGRIDGIEWGGDWHSFKDFPHYQLDSAGRSVSAACMFFESGGREG